MKNLKRVLLIVLVITAFSANAQFKFGVGGGVNLAKLSGSDINSSENILGFNGGLIMEVKLPVKLGFEADVLFSTKGASISSSDLKLSYIDMPVVMKIYMAKIINFQLGGQYSVLVRANSSGTDLKDQFNGGDMSAVVGLGLDALKIHLSARYNYGLKSIDKGGDDIKNNMLTFTVGYWIK